MSYISAVILPIIIFIIVLFGLLEKKNIFDLFVQGAKEGLELTIKIFPTLIGIFFSVSLLRFSGILDFISKILNPVLNIIKFPNEILPLALLRPISGSAAIGVATDIMKNYGVDSLIGNIASVIMGSTETTFYTIAIYTSCVKIKNSRGVLIAALMADTVGILTAVAFCKIMS